MLNFSISGGVKTNINQIKPQETLYSEHAFNNLVQRL
jgi:hypothetical protein